jgi:glycosyltransferase involved in cell wall biosynthesis
MSKIIYIGPFLFPNGGAAARRILGNAKSFRDAGYEVVIASGQVEDGIEAYPHYSTYEGFEVVSLGERSAEHYPRLLKHMMYLNMGQKSIQWLDSLNSKPKAIVLYSGYSPYMMKLIPWCKKNGVEFVFDAVEWYEHPKSFLRGLFSPYQINIELALRFFIKKTNKAIVISSFLNSHYKKNNVDTLLIPPTIDLNNIKYLTNVDNNKLSIAYTGKPDDKDFFNNYLEAVFNVNENKHYVDFYFAGITISELLLYEACQKRNINSHNIPVFLKCYENVSHEKALNIVKNADFSVLMRPKKRFAQAGFPTKVVESLSLGTPVICNITSDLGDYIQDMQTGLVCEDYSVESLKVAIQKALKLNIEEKQQMRIKARKMAEVSFDYRLYVDRLKNFIEETK